MHGLGVQDLLSGNPGVNFLGGSYCTVPAAMHRFQVCRQAANTGAIEGQNVLVPGNHGAGANQTDQPLQILGMHHAAV